MKYSPDRRYKIVLACSLLLTTLWLPSSNFAQSGPENAHAIGQPNPAAPAELEQFKFMLGEFTRRERARNQDGSWGDWQEGEWNARYFMDGYGILDETKNFVTGVVTANLRLYDEDAGYWRVTYLKLPGYSALTAEGGLEGEDLVLVNTASNDRWVFSNITDNSYDWTLYIQLNGQFIPVREIQAQRRTH